MSFARGFSLNGAKIGMNVCTPQECFLNFVVDSTNGNGLGVRSIRSNGFVERVFMYSTHASSSNGNPNWIAKTNMFPNGNPVTTASGIILIQMKQNFNHVIGAQFGQIAPVSGSSLKVDNGATLTIGAPYVVVSVDSVVATAPTAAQLAALGLPVGVAPAVGEVFVALATGASSANVSTMRVQAIVPVNFMQVQGLGDSNQAISTNISQFAGQILAFQCLAPTVTGGTSAFEAPLIGTQPADGTVISARLSFDGSSVSIDGL
jgi:hypothetical protein